jgi:hypothetical protein
MGWFADHGPAGVDLGSKRASTFASPCIGPLRCSKHSTAGAPRISSRPSGGLSKRRDGRDPLAIGGPFHTKADLM